MAVGRSGGSVFLIVINLVILLATLVYVCFQLHSFKEGASVTKIALLGVLLANLGKNYYSKWWIQKFVKLLHVLTDTFDRPYRGAGANAPIHIYTIYNDPRPHPNLTNWTNVHRFLVDLHQSVLVHSRVSFASQNEE